MKTVTWYIDNANPDHNELGKAIVEVVNKLPGLTHVKCSTMSALINYGEGVAIFPIEFYAAHRAELTVLPATLLPMPLKPRAEHLKNMEFVLERYLSKH